MRRLRRRIVSFVLIVGTVAAPAGLVAASGASAADWLPSQSMTVSASDVAVDGQGNAVAVGKSGFDQLRASTRAVGDAWTTPATISTADDSLVTEPKVSVDARGNAIAVWSAYSATASARVVRASRRPAGGTWSAPVRLSQGAAYFAPAYAIATDRQGTTTVAWTELAGSNYILKAVSRSAGSSWSSVAADVITLTTGGDGNVLSPDVAVGDRGAATVAWVGSKPRPGGSGVDSVIRSRSRDVSWDEWDDTHEVSTGGVVEAPKVAVDPAGNATVIWDQNEGGHGVRVARRPADGSWDDVRTNLGSGQQSQVAVDAAGRVTVVWVAPTWSGASITMRSRPASGGWSEPGSLATTESRGDVTSPWVATDDQGAVTVIWGRVKDSVATAEVVRQVDGNDLDDRARLTVGVLSAFPAAAIDPKGHVMLAWTGPASLPGASSIFDPVAPELRSLVVPEVGVVGEPVGVSVAPFDLTAVTTTWDFGGTSASGPAASYVFATPGRYTVTVTGTDAAGNAAQASRPITIVPPATKGSPGPPDSTPVPTPNPVPVSKAPVLSGLQQTSARWTLRKRRGSKVPVGTSFRFRLDRAAQVRLSFAQLVSGRRSGKRCVKASKANRKKRTCERVEQRGTLNAFGKAGANGIEFRGKVGGRALKPGRYRVKVTATADGRTSKAATKTFTIVR